MDTKNVVEAREVPEEIQDCHPLVSSDWGTVSSRIPVDIDTLAKETKALQRKREVKSPMDLLRLVLAYSVCDWSLRLVGAWAAIIGLGCLSDVAIRKRLRNSKAWLGGILGEWLLQRRTDLPQRSVMMRLIDASTGSNPGSKGIDWRVHANFDLATFSIASVEVTDVKGGETLARHVMQAGVIYLGDRGYAHRRGLGEALAASAYVILRTNATNLPFETGDGKPFDLLFWLRSDSESSARETNVWVTTPNGRFEIRLIAGALPEKKAEQARRRLQKSSRKKGHTPSEISLVAAGFVLLVSNLPTQDWPAQQVLAAYRLRWQVELLFRRLKGILDLDAVRAKDPVLSQVYLMGKLVGMLMLEDWDRDMIARQPDWFQDIVRPISQWRWTWFCADMLRQAIRGPITTAQVSAVLPRLSRYFRDGPRKRQQQAAHARRWLNAIGIPVEMFGTLTQHESMLA